MFSHIEQVLRRGRWHDPPAYTLILGAGASFGAVPTVKQMFGLQENGTIHPQCIPAWVYQLDYRRTLPTFMRTTLAGTLANLTGDGFQLFQTPRTFSRNLNRFTALD